MYSISCFFGTFKNKRENNEDNLNICSFVLPLKHEDVLNEQVFKSSSNPSFGLFDGLGGESAGEYASYTAASVMNDYTDMSNYYEGANTAICNLKNTTVAEKAGSTAVILEINGDKFRCSNIGDSRAYLIRQGNIRLISKDHTTYETMISMGAMTQAQLEKANVKNTLSQCLGMDEKEEVVISPHFTDYELLKNGDIFVLCSDGLTGGLSDELIKKYVTGSEPSKKTIAAVYQKAVEGGSTDNTSIILLKIQEKPSFINSLFSWFK